MNDFKGKKIELLISQLKESEDIDLRCSALEELASSQEDNDQIVPAIISALADDNWLVRSEAANTLRLLGTKALSALPALRNSILEPRNKSKKGIFYSAIKTLEKIEAEGPVDKPADAEPIPEPIVEEKAEEKIPEVVIESPTEVIDSPTEPHPEAIPEPIVSEDKEAIEEAIEDFIEDAVEDDLEDAVEEITDEKFDDDVLEDIAEEIAEDVADEVTEDVSSEPIVDTPPEEEAEEIEEALEDVIEDAIEDAVEDVSTEPIDEDSLEEVAEDIAEEIVEDISESQPESTEEISETVLVEETPTESSETTEAQQPESIPEQEVIEEVSAVKDEENVSESSTDTTPIQEQSIQKELTTRKISKTIMKIILVGEGPVGKTSIRRKYVNDDFTHEYNEVFGADITSKQLKIREEDFVYQFWDVATGDHSYFSSEIFFRGTNSVLLIYDVSQRESFINITNLITEIVKIEGKDLIFFLVGNKVDLRENQEIDCVTKPEGFELAEKLSQEYGIKIPYFETSTITGEGIDDLFKTVINDVSTQYFLRKEE